MSNEEFEKLCKPRSEWRNFETHPITKEEVEAMKPIREADKKRQEAQRWTPEKWANLHRPMDI